MQEENLIGRGCGFLCHLRVCACIFRFGYNFSFDGTIQKVGNFFSILRRARRAEDKFLEHYCNPCTVRGYTKDNRPFVWRDTKDTQRNRRPREVVVVIAAKLMSRYTKLSTVCILFYIYFVNCLNYWDTFSFTKYIEKLKAEGGRGRHLCKTNVPKYKTKYRLYTYYVFIHNI